MATDEHNEPSAQDTEAIRERWNRDDYWTRGMRLGQQDVNTLLNEIHRLRYRVAELETQAQVD